MAADLGNTETIDQLKNWISDCMERDRSPSPDFIKPQEKNIEIDETDHIQNVHSNEPVSQTPEGKIYPPGYIPTLDEIKEGKQQLLKCNASTKFETAEHFQ